MTNFDKAAELILPYIGGCTECDRIGDACLDCTREAKDAVKDIAEAGLLAPDLPAPDTSLPSGEREWNLGDGYVNLHDGEILVSYDERNEETYLTEPAPEPGQIRITDAYNARQLAYALLAVTYYKEEP